MSTKFQHKTLPIVLDYADWNKLSTIEKNDFSIVNTSTTVNNTVVTNNRTEDVLGLGKVAETAVGVALLPLALLGVFD